MVQEIGTIGLPALRSFSAVARLGGISAAADRLGMAKSGVSRHVAQLEAHFGVRLLERGARSVKLTPVGERLSHRIASILAELDLLDEIAREENIGISGRVSIAATPEFGGLVASTLFPIIGDLHPQIKIVMRTAYGFEDMQDPSTDIAFRVGTFKDDRLVARQLGAFRAVPVATPEFLQDYPAKTPQDLANTPCLVFRGDETATRWTLYGLGSQTTVNVGGSIGVRSFTILKEMALAGRGVAFLPEFMVTDAIRSGTLVPSPAGFYSRSFPVFLTYRPGARRIARLETVIKLAEMHVSEMLSNMPTNRLDNN